jgi:hypothetical protein
MCRKDRQDETSDANQGKLRLVSLQLQPLEEYAVPSMLDPLYSSSIPPVLSFPSVF